MISKSLLSEQTKQILARSPFKETEVQTESSIQMLTRYGNNQITQNVEQETVSVSIRANDRGRTARVDTDQLDPESIDRTYARLKKILSVMPEAEEVAPLHRSGDRYASVSRDTFEPLTPQATADIVGRAVDKARKGGFTTSGIFSTSFKISALANSEGLFLTDELSDSEFTCTMDGKGGAGRGFTNETHPSALDTDGAIDRAYSKCRDSVKSQPIDPGEYDVILEPAAFAEILVFLGWIGFSGKAYSEDRSFCFGKLGKKLFDDRLTLFDDPLDRRIGGSYFDGEGVPRRRVDFVKNGILKELAVDTKTARKLGVAPTGHGMSEPNADDPVPWNLSMDWSGPKKSQEEMIQGVRRGILVSQFHYVNVVDVMVPSLTGMTRNGTFLVENGKIVGPVRNLRFTQSMSELLNQIECVSPNQERISCFFGGASLAPTVLARKFHFSSSTEF